MRPRNDSRRELPGSLRPGGFRKEPTWGPGGGKSFGETSSLAEAMRWVHRITAIGVEMVIPTVCGWYIDHRFDCRPWGVVIGALLGFWVAGWSLVALIRAAEAESASETAVETQMVADAGKNEEKNGGDSGQNRTTR